MDVGAIQAASVATTASYRSFADATRSVLDLLESHLPDATLFLSHLDRGHNVHRIVDTRGGETFGLQANQATPLRDSYCGRMADDMGPRRCDDLAAHPAYATLDIQQQLGAVSYLGVPLELSDQTRVGSLAALSRTPSRFSDADEQLFAVLARVLSSELERESSTRDLQRMSETLREHARGLAALGRVTKALSGSRDARPAVCRAACEVTSSPVAFLLEPSGREFVSTAMVGVDIAPVTIQPRPESEYGSRAFTSRQSYFVADARAHPALAAPLVEATGARSALFEPVLRGDQIAGVLILIWRHAVDSIPDAVADMLSLLAAQAAVAIEREELRSRVGALALSRPADRPRHPPDLGRRAAARARARPPLRGAGLDRRHRPRPPERVQHAPRRAGGRPPGQGVLVRLARAAARGRPDRPPGGRRVRRAPPGLRARRGVRRARARPCLDAARPDRLGRRRPLGRRGARRPAARPLRRRARRRQVGRARHDDRRRLERPGARRTVALKGATMMEFRISVLEVGRGGGARAGREEQTLLACCCCIREIVSPTWLMDELWGEEPTASATKAVQGYVCGLRRILGAETIVTRRRGYVLTPGRLDADAFERLAAEAKGRMAGDEAAAAELLREALALWRGEPLQGIEFEGLAHNEAERLGEQSLGSRSRWRTARSRLPARCASWRCCAH